MSEYVPLALSAVPVVGILVAWAGAFWLYNRNRRGQPTARLSPALMVHSDRKTKPGTYGVFALLLGVAALVFSTHENIGTILAIFAGSAFVASAVAEERP